MDLPKLIFTDIDGVWTDGGMYYDQTGNEWKKFNTSDSWGVTFCRACNIETVIVSGEDTQIVVRRAAKLKISECYLGIKDKLAFFTDYLNKKGISWSEVAFIGDDINDYLTLQKVGFSGCPNNAPSYIKSIVNFTGKKNGGDGAFREFVEHILLQHFSIEELIRKVHGQ